MQIGNLSARKWATKSLEQSKYNSRGEPPGHTEWPAGLPGLSCALHVELYTLEYWPSLTSRKRHF